MSNEIVIHCADTPNHMPYTAAQIHKWHQDKGWDGIGYHYVIEVDGNTVQGRPIYWQGAHVRGHNTGTIGICMVGRTQYSWKQHQALRTLISELVHDKKVSSSVVGHYQLDDKKRFCPGFDVPDWLRANGLEELAVYDKN